MASTLNADRDADRPGPSSPSRRRFLGDGDLDILLRKAGLSLDSGPGTEAADEGEHGGDGGRRLSDGDCRVGQCIMPPVIQRLATVRSFTAMCCGLAALTGNNTVN